MTEETWLPLYPKYQLDPHEDCATLSRDLYTAVEWSQACHIAIPSTVPVVRKSLG